MHFATKYPQTKIVRCISGIIYDVIVDLRPDSPTYLKWEGFYLSEENNKVLYVENNSLVACFDDQVDIDIVDEICKSNPMKVVFKDISFKTDKDKINLEERIKKLSPETEISIL